MLISPLLRTPNIAIYSRQSLKIGIVHIKCILISNFFWRLHHLLRVSFSICSSCPSSPFNYKTALSTNCEKVYCARSLYYMLYLLRPDLGSHRRQTDTQAEKLTTVVCNFRHIWALLRRSILSEIAVMTLISGHCNKQWVERTGVILN